MHIRTKYKFFNLIFNFHLYILTFLYSTIICTFTNHLNILTFAHLHIIMIL